MGLNRNTNKRRKTHRPPVLKPPVDDCAPAAPPQSPAGENAVLSAYPPQSVAPQSNDTPACPEPESREGKARSNGKVARLPKILRDKVNLMIQDGFSYPAIIESL